MFEPLLLRLQLIIYNYQPPLKLIIIMANNQVIEEVSHIVGTAIAAAKGSTIGERFLCGIKAGSKSFMSAFLTAFIADSADVAAPTNPPA